MPVDYSKGKIYKITSKQTPNCYVGSTVKSLTARLSLHKQPCNRTSSKDILKYDDAIIELIEDFPCNSKEQLVRRESYWIRNTPNCINICTPYNVPEVANAKEYIIFEDYERFLILSEETKTVREVKKITPVDAPPGDCYRLTVSNLISALKEYKYDTKRRKEKYHRQKEERLKKWEEENQV